MLLSAPVSPPQSKPQPIQTLTPVLTKPAVTKPADIFEIVDDSVELIEISDSVTATESVVKPQTPSEVSVIVKQMPKTRDFGSNTLKLNHNFEEIYIKQLQTYTKKLQGSCFL